MPCTEYQGHRNGTPTQSIRTSCRALESDTQRIHTVVWPRASEKNDLTSLGITFSICEMGTRTPPLFMDKPHCYSVRKKWEDSTNTWQRQVKSEGRLVTGGGVQSLSCVRLSLWPYGPQHARLPVLHYPPEFAQTHVH